MAATKTTRNAEGIARVHNPPKFPLALSGSRRKPNMATAKKNVTAIAVKSSPPARQNTKPKSNRGKAGGRRANPFRVANPQTVFAFALTVGAAGVGNELFNRGVNLILPVGIQGWARGGIKLGAAYLIRNNKTVDRFSGGNAGAIALVIGSLAVVDLVRPYIDQAIAGIRGFLPALPAAPLPPAPTVGNIADYYPPGGMGNIVDMPSDWTSGY
jgi:hypothetical protein